ncbi:MAG TPA: alkaline phosphatase family protein [Pyrinomonadaceae bacterium]|nr:alkaline phosphatase family protein [Pyrinomonadaceae bacterium]
MDERNAQGRWRNAKRLRVFSSGSCSVSATSLISPPRAGRRSPLAARRRRALAFVACAWLLLAAPGAFARGARRLVVVKVDGLSQAVIDRYVGERDPRTGKSLLPWFEHVFYERGTRLANFYVRGLSLSGPSWSLLDTGQHLQIKGNVEFDRLALHSYDYLNFIPFWLGTAGKMRVDMPGAELLDELGVPLLVDSYPYDERHVSFQLYQRGTRWTTLERGLKNRFLTRTPRELFDEWLVEFEVRNILMEQLERELLEKLKDPRIRYLDFYTTEFDHAAHHNRDRETQLVAVRELDRIIGRIWTTIEATPQANETALVVVSDHGTNTDERIYSQGFNLVKLLGSRAGGGHHVITKRRLLSDYALKGIYPLVPLITTTTEDSYYLEGRSTDYPTALVDFDGNERASIHLRHTDLNVLHILLEELRGKRLSPALARAATEAFFQTIETHRARWQKLHADMQEELAALGRLVERERALVAAQPKKWTRADADAGRDQAARRIKARADSSAADIRLYAEYARTLANLLSLKRENFDAARINVADYLAKGSMGDQNSIDDLRNYVVGLGAGGLMLAPDGSLDLQKSFTRVNYFALLREARVRNNVQSGVDSRPVDFVAARVPAEALTGAHGKDFRADEAVWLYRGEDTQALLLARRERDGELRLRYVPVANLHQEPGGLIRYERAAWRAELPLKMWEDAKLSVPPGVRREDWLDGWHTDLEWLRALHLTTYSNGLVGLQEHFGRHVAPAIAADVPGLSVDEQLIRRFRRRQRLLVETDMLVLANNHWNFDVRGFNPGGNHGSFFRVSTHSTLMLAGGAATRIPRALVIREPYDSLSFVPTILALTNQLPPPAQISPARLDERPRPYPGRIINELFDSRQAPPVPTVGAAASSGAPAKAEVSP